MRPVGYVGFERVVIDRIEHRDDVSVHFDGVGHVHVPANRPSQAFGDDGLAVAGRAVEKQRLARIDGGAELFEDVVADDEMREASAESIASDIAAGCHQPAHFAHVGRPRNRRGADVCVRVEILPRAIASRVRQVVSVTGGRARAGCAPNLDEAFDARVLDEQLQHVEGQPHAIGHGQARRLARVQRLHQQLFDVIGPEACFLERRGDPRRRRGSDV